jgi:hypothetical protein
MVGVWESGQYIGCVLFSRGANRHLTRPYGLAITEGCELTRVALNAHQTPVSKIITIALRFLKQQSPGMRLVISFADPAQGHHGGIYQATNWLYTGQTAPAKQYVRSDGKILHARQVSPSGVKKQYGRYRVVPQPDQCRIVEVPGKHRYLMPLDKETRMRLQNLHQPYPKKRVGSDNGDTTGDQPVEGGSTPTPTLQNNASR